MRRTRVLIRFGVAMILLGGLSIAEPAGPAEAPRVLRVKEHRDRAVPLRQWDSRSPQRLVRIEGDLYQQDAGSYFPVIPGRITVRPVEGVEDWKDLVERASAAAPGLFESLHRLKPIRVNRLGVVTLSTPADRDLTSWCDLVYRTGLARYAEVSTYGTFLATANDPRYPEQWSLNNTGQTGGTPGADVDAERAWDITTGDSSIIVAVLDSGTDIDHEDLAANVWHNVDETPGNGIDDDNNGFIDDWEGWDFHNDNNEPRPVHPHGTHVTGIINAVGGNGIGIAGLAGGLGSPGVLGMALGVGDEAENGDVIDDAILYAADNGAQVITMSLSTAETQAINDALDYAYETADLFIDCAAGNGGDEVSYPARHPAVMAVASTDHNDVKSSFSNPGPEVEIAAPGSDILSTRPDGNYTSGSGTSYAAPHVAALAALMRGRNPALQAADVRQLILETAEDVGEPGFDFGTGHGRINAFEGVTLAATSDGIVRFLGDVFSCDGTVELFVVDFDIASAGTVTVDVSSDTEPGGEPVVLTESAVGSGLFRGSIPVSYDAAVPDGVLQMAHGDALLAEYVDLDDGQGGSGVSKSDTASADCRAPWISNVAVEDVSGATVAITWDTDEDSTSRVAYGETNPPTEAIGDVSPVTLHHVELTGLSACTIYRFSVSSTDAAENTAVSDNEGSYHHFETLGDFGQGLQPCHQGRIAIDLGSVGCASSVPVTVGDMDLNTDPGIAETVTVTVTSTTEPVSEPLVLTETGPDTSTFSATIPTAEGLPVPGDGILHVAHDDLVTATYEDADDGTGSSRISFDTAPVDCEGPLHTTVLVTDVTDSHATIQWSTSKPSTGFVEWGTTPAFGNEAHDTELTIDHEVTIGAFAECGPVYFRVVSADAEGYSSVADAGGAPFSFDGYEGAPSVFEDDFETDVGWTLGSEWEIGAPQGLGTAPGDPASAFSGSGVLGHDLSGLGDRPGDYEPQSNTSATSPSFDASSLSNGTLYIQRWLNVAVRGQAFIDVKDASGVWRTPWGSSSHSGATSSSWIPQELDISLFADGNPDLQIRFRQAYGTTLEVDAGWNVDEMIVRDSSLPAFDVCSACGTPPTFAGLVEATDDDPCSDSGVTLSWSPAPSWGSSRAGTYAVYRDTQPGFTPSSANVIASGIAATTWSDPAPPNDVDLYYVVRAENDESCGTGPGNGGMIDENLVRVVARDETGQAAPQDPGSTLVVSPVNRSHVRLDWAIAANTPASHVYRAPRTDGEPVQIGAVQSSTFEDTGALADGETWYYLVLGADACGNEAPR